MTGDNYSGTLSSEETSELKTLLVSILDTLQELNEIYETSNREEKDMKLC
jgi:hypothetical protein